MKTTTLQAQAEALTRPSLHHQPRSIWTNRHQTVVSGVIALVCLACLPSQAAEPTYKLFGREVGGYSDKLDLPAVVQKELGSRATIADWDELKAHFGKSESEMKKFCEQTGLKLDGSAWVTQSGKRIWQDRRHYFIYRADHKLPEDFKLHDQAQDNFLLLGSWFGERPVLVRITDYNATDAAKWAKWDKLFLENQQKEIAGVYILLSIDGKKVPATLTHEGASLQIKGGSFTITATGACASQMTFVPPNGAETKLTRQATYTREGPKLNMQWTGAGMTSGTVVGNTFTMGNEGMVFVYQK